MRPMPLPVSSIEVVRLQPEKSRAFLAELIDRGNDIICWRCYWAFPVAAVAGGNLVGVACEATAALAEQLKYRKSACVKLKYIYEYIGISCISLSTFNVRISNLQILCFKDLLSKINMNKYMYINLYI